MDKCGKYLVICLTGLFVQTGIAATVDVSLSLVAQRGNAKPIGKVTFEDSADGLLITPHLRGLSAGAHGFHIHTAPSCDNFGQAALGHYDPKKTNKHAGPYSDSGHLGDLPVVTVDKKGRASTQVLAPRVTVQTLRGRAVVLHRGGDNYSDKPKLSGGGGDRIACGIVSSSQIKSSPSTTKSSAQKPTTQKPTAASSTTATSQPVAATQQSASTQPVVTTQQPAPAQPVVTTQQPAPTQPVASAQQPAPVVTDVKPSATMPTLSQPSNMNATTTASTPATIPSDDDWPPQFKPAPMPTTPVPASISKPASEQPATDKTKNKSSSVRKKLEKLAFNVTHGVPLKL